MSSTLRAVSKHSRSLSRSLTAARQTRAFHSPFAVLYTAQPTTHAAPPAYVSPLYEKQVETTAAPTLSPSGQRTYVVSEPDPHATPYEVPYGAYPTSAPYRNYPATDAPLTSPRSSTSPDLAHPVTTRAAPQNPTGSNDAAGIQESAAVRFRDAPGQLSPGSDGGLGLMDAASTKPGEGELASRNPQPDDPKVAEKFSALGVDNAWKERK